MIFKTISLILFISTFGNLLASNTIKTYLVNHGYLDSENIDSKSLEKGISCYQKSWYLKETGTINSETQSLMNLPRCGCPDKPIACSLIRQGYTEQKWNNKTITYSLKAGTSYMGLDVMEIKETIKKAFDVWSKPSGLKFIEDAHQSDITLDFYMGEEDNRHTFDGSGGQFAYAFNPIDHNAGDISFDSAEQFTLDVPNPNGLNLFQVAVHEIGHALGLQHSQQRNSVMYPYYLGYDPNFRLSWNDIENIQRLYENGKPSPIDACYDASEFDFIATESGSTFAIRNEELYEFQDNKFEKIDKQSIWPNLPNNIDAALSINGFNYIFKDDKVYKFMNQELVSEHKTAEMIDGMPSNIDSAFRIPGTDMIVLTKRDKYYIVGFHENGLYIRDEADLSSWWPHSEHIDSAFIDRNGILYIFSSHKYYRYNASRSDIDKYYPRDIAYWWFGCQEKAYDVESNQVMKMAELMSRDVNEAPSMKGMVLDSDLMTFGLHDYSKMDTSENTLAMEPENSSSKMKSNGLLVTFNLLVLFMFCKSISFLQYRN